MLIQTNKETVSSLPLLAEPKNSKFGWQEICILTFCDSHPSKVFRHRLRAEISVKVGASYGEVSVWASSSWKSIARVALENIPAINYQLMGERAGYAKAIDWLVEVGAKVVGG